jgi:hypothetical protein
MENTYTICKFIRNKDYDRADKPAKYPLVSRSLGKIALPSFRSSMKLDPIRHNDTFWVVEIIAETGVGNKGIIEVNPLYQVEPTPLVPGLFDIEPNGHWVFLRLKAGVPIRPYFVPQNIKKPFLQPPDNLHSVVCVPYDGLALAELKPLQ